MTDAVVARYMGYLKDEADTLEGLMRHGHAPQHLATAIAASVQRLRGHTAVLEELRKR